MLKSLNLEDIRQKTIHAVDHRVRMITAGLGLNELRAVMRGDPPTEKPNPRYKVHTTSFLFHIRPRYYELGSTIFTHTWRLGFFTAFFFFVELFTGIILMLYYTPSPEKAYSSIVGLLTNVPYGQMLRDIHRLGAEAMVIFTFLHMLRTYLTGSYKKDRSFTWLTGLVLLGITLLLSFSGYLLPWDQLAYWAVTVGTSMADAAPLIGNQLNLLLRGAPDIAANGLLRFYLLHVILLPLAAILVISIHYYKVSREHGISLPASIEEGDVSPEKKRIYKQRVDFIPDLFTHEVFLVSLGLLILVLGVTVFNYHAPLESVANPQATPLDTKAPWYFWWLQGMLKLGDKVLMGIIIPTILVGVLVALPYIDWNPNRSMVKRPIAVSLGVLAVLALVMLSYMGTPRFGIEADAATRIIPDMAPEEGTGPMRQVPFDQLQAGVYQVGVAQIEDMCPTLDYGCPQFERVFKFYGDYVDEMTKRGRLPAEHQALVIVEDWQQDLKKITMRIIWTEPDGTSKTYERHFYLHRNRGSE
jgi:quinol-cytochrome oxidoreductase complex cytochrome b subunit